MSKKICLYALSTCIHCRNTKEFLDDNKIEYICFEVDKLQGEERERVIAEIRKVNPRLSFPTLLIDDQVIVGFKKDEIEEALKS
ncbi:MAG: glutaredoxin family protein [Deltaproteobacteria bacterium]|nr:glutaredoxin family protein [Deltaproteobacteria bacterium]